MAKYYCNPVNLRYHFQFYHNRPDGSTQIAREGADPSLILFQGRYYLFPSMNLSVYVSEDLVSWECHPLPDALPLYDYAPDARVIGEYVYFCASNKDRVCHFYRTRDVLQGPYEEIPGSFPFWDPNLFADEDGSVYFYWGCSAMTPIWGVKMDPRTMRPLGEPVELIHGHPEENGYERIGEDHCIRPGTDAEVEAAYQKYLQEHGIREEDLPPHRVAMIKSWNSRRPYIEGAWMDKQGGRYYLQYACTGTDYNIYGDGVYVSDRPLGPFVPAKNNPYSYQPGGFITGAGHGSTMRDRDGNVWHASTMRISVNHNFERRVGIWPAGWDAEGELFCNQRYGDWPVKMQEGARDPWTEPEWFLLSRGKPMTASSSTEGHSPELAAEEDIRTWWTAGTAAPGEWLQMDLGEGRRVHAIQINFAEDEIRIPIPGKVIQNSQARFIDSALHPTRWKIEGSMEGRNWFLIEDKSECETDLSHDLIIREKGIQVRFLRLTIIQVPYGQRPSVSDLRVFGRREGERPDPPVYEAARENDLDMRVRIHRTEASGAEGYLILWGTEPEKLYHSRMTWDQEVRIGALVKGTSYWVRVDAFNESGITHGAARKLR